MPTENATDAEYIHDPHAARKLARILSIQPDPSRPLTQFDFALESAYEWAIRWVHDFSLGCAPRPNFPDEVFGRLQSFHETRVNDYLRKQALPRPIADAPNDQFALDLMHNLNTHVHGVPHGRNLRNIHQPKYAQAIYPLPADNDPLAAWSRQALTELKRVGQDPEYRTAVSQRISSESSTIAKGIEPISENTSADPEHAARIVAILSAEPNESKPLTQFSPEQLAAYLWAVRWLHDFNLDRMPKPNFSDEVLARLSDFHGVQMNERFRQKEAAPH